jgi:hypothetical protein
MVVLTARLHPDEAARVMEALRVSAETGCPADGLCALAESALRGDKPERPATEVVLRVDSDTLEGSFDDGTGVCAQAAHTSNGLPFSIGPIGPDGMAAASTTSFVWRPW